MLRRIWNYASNNALVAGLVLLLIGSGSVWAWVAPARAWLSADAPVMRGALVVLALLLLTALAIILRLTTALRRARNQASGTAAPQVPPQVPVRFAPDSFTLNGPRARALLSLLEHPEAHISLHTIHQAVQRYQRYVDHQTSPARVQLDMEEAAHAGIVRIDPVTGGGNARCYYLTTDGRNWALLNEGELKKFAPRGTSVADRFT